MSTSSSSGRSNQGFPRGGGAGVAHGTCRETMTSIPPFPQEILDYIVDILQDEPQTLRDCCLVAKSWAPRTRKHLFAHVTFNSPSRLEAWKKTFLDHTNSPASYTRPLLVISVGVVITSADVDENSWVLAFSNVVRLTVRNGMRPGLLQLSTDSPQFMHLSRSRRSSPLCVSYRSSWTWK